MEGENLFLSGAIETIADGLQHVGHAGFDFVGGDAEYAIAKNLELTLAFGIGVTLSGMNRPINLDDQASQRAAEVGNERPDWVLPSKDMSLQPATSQFVPQEAFAFSGLTAESSSRVCELIAHSTRLLKPARVCR